MRTFIGGHQVVSDTDFIELALGTPVELWLGVEGESEMERAARLDAARDILADNPNLPDDVSRVAAEAIESFAPELFNVLPLPASKAARRRPRRNGVAA
jgi:Lon protease-like protein